MSQNFHDLIYCTANGIKQFVHQFRLHALRKISYYRFSLSCKPSCLGMGRPPTRQYQHTDIT